MKTSLRPRWFAAALAALLPASGAPALTAPAVTAPAFNWVLPLFTDQDGYRSMTLRGSEVRYAGETTVVADLSITVFSETAAARVESVLLSPKARFVPKTRRASGDAGVRLIRDDIEVTAVSWDYDHDAKRVSLQGKVRVVFQTQLNDILK